MNAQPRTTTLTLVSPQPARDDLLRILHPDEYHELRAIDLKRKAVLGQEHVRTDGVDGFADSFNHLNLYVGVAVRADVTGKGTLANCSDLHCLFVDFDFHDQPEADVRRTLREFPVQPTAVVNSGGGLQVYWWLHDPLDLRNGKAPFAKDLLQALVRKLGADIRAAEPARVLRLPGTFNYKYEPPRPVVLETLDESRRYPLEAFTGLLPLSDTDTERRRSEQLPDAVGEGARNHTLYVEGCRVRRFGWNESEIAKALAEINRQRCHPPLAEGEVVAIARSCAKHAPAEDSYPTTEAGDAEFFAALFADQVRFDHRRGQWLVFHGHGWKPQTDGEVHRLALDAIRARQIAATKIEDSKEREARLKHAIGGEQLRRQRALLALVQNIKPIADTGDNWDADPWLLGVQNGVLDLRTGTLRDGRPEDRITLCVRASFVPDATCPLWDETVAEIFGGDQELIGYFDRYIGYSLTGDCREESLAFCWGTGANGKGTLMNTVGWLLGDYADDLPFSALEMHDRAGIPNDIAKLVGKRFVTSSETGETRRLNEARIKALTGRDPITARFLHREFFTFQPVAKFWLATNQKPEVRDTSVGFWRRMHLIPFTRSFAAKPDLQLKDKLRQEAPGILARAVRGCLVWQGNGLNPPEAVRRATRQYQDDSTPTLDRFVAECCVLGDAKTATAGALYAAYQWWSKPFGGRLTRREFMDELPNRFAKDENEYKRTQRVTYKGIGIVDRISCDL